MTFIQGLILGMIQGMAEWLPISSEGINTLVLLQFFSTSPSEAISMSIWLHTGTVIAALVYFRRDVMDILKNIPKYIKELGDSHRSELDKTITFLIISTLVTGLIATPMVLFIINNEVLSENIRTMLAGDKLAPASLAMAGIGLFLIITALVQKYAHQSSGMKTGAGIKDAVLLGVVQAFSVFPGLSRSGLTVSALLFRGYQAKYAIRISFLMSIPVVLIAEVGIMLINGVTLDLPSAASIATAFVFGILTIGALLRIANKIHFWKFCLFLGGLSFLPLLLDSI